MKAKKTVVWVLLIAGALAAVWILNEDRARRAGRLNATSHLRQVGLGFRYQQNDIVGFKLTGDVVVARTPPGTSR